LIDATEPLATRDQDGDVISAMNHFYKRHGLLHMQNCCQFVKERDFVIDESDFKGLRKASESMDSLTDYYLLDYPSWEKMDDDALDRQKEEQEHKLLFFQLDPTKKKMEEKKEMLEKKHAGLKKVDTVKKVLPKKMSTNNKMQQLDVDPSVPKPKRKESIVLPTTPSDPLLRKQDELKSFETETKKGTRIEPRSAQKQAKPTDIRAQSKSAGVRLNK
jgi:hypothetical protein